MYMQHTIPIRYGPASIRNAPDNQQQQQTSADKVS